MVRHNRSMRLVFEQARQESKRYTSGLVRGEPGTEGQVTANSQGWKREIEDSALVLRMRYD